jgi:phosphoribosyl 1,2-cyclic phosphate phosphodiesterase
MKLTLLGCGSSGGVPLIGCDCAVCTSTDPKNKRSRVSVLLETTNTRLIIDTGPDFRQQVLTAKLKTVDAILYTHAHADHTHGIDELRSFNYHADAPLPIYGDAATLKELQHRFGYVFLPPTGDHNWYRASLIPHIITPYVPFTIGDITLTPFAQDHGPVNSMGFRFGDIAYSTDVKHLPEASWKVLEGIKIWVVDCLSHGEKPTHAHLDLALEWINRLKPERAILTHMGHEFDYATLQTNLPEGVEAAWDGMEIFAKGELYTHYPNY